MRWAWAGALILALVPAATIDERRPVEKLAALNRDWERAESDFQRRLGAATTDAAWEAVFATHPMLAFQDRFMDLARAHPADPAVFDALLWTLDHPVTGLRAGRNYRDALAILGGHFLEDPRLADACLILGFPSGRTDGAWGVHPDAERLLRLALDRSPTRKVRGEACFSLAKILRRRASWRLGGMTRAESDAIAAEAVRRYEQVVAEFADIPWGGPDTLGDVAGDELYEIRHLAVGMAAPDIVGEDLDGAPLRLSDYRGKVVVLTFWAGWCGPCLAMIPDEKALAARMAGRPFALVGCNGDDDRDAARRAAAKAGVTWRSWWDAGDRGPIVRRWNVMAWPTTYVLDAGGVIRFKNVRGKEIDAAVDALMGPPGGQPPPDP